MSGCSLFQQAFVQAFCATHQGRYRPYYTTNTVVQLDLLPTAINGVSIMGNFYRLTRFCFLLNRFHLCHSFSRHHTCCKTLYGHYIMAPRPCLLCKMTNGLVPGLENPLSGPSQNQHFYLFTLPSSPGTRMPTEPKNLCRLHKITFRR